jgi:ubiquitin C
MYENHGGMSAMQITVKCVTGESYEIEAEAHNPALNVKAAIQDMTGLTPEMQRLIYAGKQLDDNTALSDYGVTEGSELTLLTR